MIVGGSNCDIPDCRTSRFWMADTSCQQQTLANARLGRRSYVRPRLRIGEEFAASLVLWRGVGTSVFGAVVLEQIAVTAKRGANFFVGQPT